MATLVEKLWDAHVVDKLDDQTDLLYIDLHLMHEATSPQAFDGLRIAERPVRRPDLTLAVEDHNVPTDSLEITDALGLAQVTALRENCAQHGIEQYQIGHERQGIVHVVAPQLGLVQPGMSIVCGDSHTSTLGAFGALAFGIGTSDVEHVLATQTLPMPKPATMEVRFEGRLPEGASAKDMALAFISTVGANGARGYLVEYRGEAVSALSMEARMTLCNMSIEGGARAGLVAPDATTAAHFPGRPYAPADLAATTAAWTAFHTDADTDYTRRVTVDLSVLSPYVTWGTNPSQAVPLSGVVPDPEAYPEPAARLAATRALEYMGLAPGTPLRGLPIGTVFLGSCTNGRIEDLRAAAAVLRGRRVAPGVRMLVVPGSMAVRAQAEHEGLHEVFTAAGAEWRRPGCSMCLGLNADRVGAGERCASTSNRNFEGRQGPGARTHLVSPLVAAATAVLGGLAEPDDLP